MGKSQDGGKSTATVKEGGKRDHPHRERNAPARYRDDDYRRQTIVPSNPNQVFDNKSQKSSSSHRSNASLAQKMQAELDADNAIRDLENQYEEIQAKIAIIDVEIQQREEIMKHAQSEMVKENVDNEKMETMQNRVQKCITENSEFEAQKRKSSIMLDNVQKKIVREKTKKIQTLEVIDQHIKSEGSDGGSQIIEVENSAVRTKEWANQHANPEINHYANDAKRQSGNPEPRPKVNAIHTDANQNVSSADKILARQTQGRELPQFSGKPEEWLPFLAAYNSTTANCYYTHADNMPRLHKALKGDALAFVQHLLISPDSVPEVIEKLRMRYGQPEILVETMSLKVSQLQNVREDRPETVIEMGTLVSSLVTTIKATKLWSYMQNPSLLRDLEKKLPLPYQMSWRRDARGSAPDLQTFSDWFDDYMEAACRMAPASKSKEEKRDRNNNSSSKTQKAFATVEKKDFNSKDKPKSSDRPCSFCKETGHRNQACPQLTTLKPEDRGAFVQKHRACFGCLNRGHGIKECRSKKACGIDSCTSMHHRVLHREKKAENSSADNSEASVATPAQVIQVAAISMKTTSQCVHFMMAPITLKGPNGTVSGYAVLDSFSSITSVDENTAKKLGVRGTPQPLEVEGFGCKTSHPQSQLVNLELIPDSNKQASFTLKGVRTIRNMKLPSQSLHKSDVAKWDHLKDIQFPAYNNEQPIILIGDDNAALSDVLETRYHPNPNAPRGIRTPLGWLLRGWMGHSGSNASCFQVRHLQGDEELHNLVKQHFAVESLGISPSAPMPRSSEDERAQTIIDRTLVRVPSGFEIGLLWKDEDPVLPRSFNNALVRLKQMERKMDRSQEFADVYQTKIQEYLGKGFARKLSPAEVAKESKTTFYIPHFLAANPKKEKKWRFVFDAAAKVDGRSLNDFLLRGPDNLTPLLDILMKFRQRPIAISADIKDMFHRVQIREQDRCSQRFLFRGMDRDRDPDVMQMEVMIFGATCSPSCAQEAKNKNAAEFQHQYPKAFIPITQLHYVDDFLSSHDTVEEAIQVQEDVRAVHAKGGFQICNFLSNSVEVMKAIPEDLHAKSMKSMDLDPESLIDRVLGMYWKQGQDIFTFSLKFVKVHESVLTGERIPTKRELLSLAMSLYDPLGFLSHYTIKAKMILQQIWRSKTGWDQTIPEDTVPHWHQWREDLKQVPKFEIPRCFSSVFTTADSLELHIFGDGSEEAYGAIAFFRIVKGNAVEIAFVMSKAKVAPLKVISINRMELQAAVLCAKLKAYIHSTIDVPINRTGLWTDSNNCIFWINSDGRKFQQFVGHRIGEIQELTEASEWRWIPTELNPADEMTRLAKPCDLSKSSVRVTGPDFLLLPEDQWPIQRIKVPKPDPETIEMRKQFVHAAKEVPAAIDPTRFSDWMKLVRFVAYSFRLVNKAQKLPVPKTLSLCALELPRSQNFLFKLAQEQSFSEEIALLKKGAPLPKSVGLHKIGLILDHQEVLRVKGRIENAQLSYNRKHPIVLDRKHPITRLIVDFYHRICGHHGHERIGNEIRQMFFIPSLRQEVRAARLRCQKCKNASATPQVPEMGQLPAARLEQGIRPFTNTGVDYFGPIEVIVKRSREKRYVALFTCLSTRAIHLEIAGSLSTDSFINALRRFVARRGCPTTLYSDNGTNFIGSNRELKEALAELSQDQITNECTNKGIKWRFNPPAAPHMGGSWERMVRATKIALGSTLQIKNLHEEPLHTLLCEAEHTVNSHPLTHVPDDPEDPEALTPNHFLIGSSSNLQPFVQTSAKDLTSRKQWRVVQQMAEHFWKRWVREFLPTLLRREKWCQPTRPIQVGDVVLEVDNNHPRNTWPKARVTQLHPGKDGKVRVVDLKRGNGKEYRRPVSKLCVLDVEPKQDKVSV